MVNRFPSGTPWLVALHVTAGCVVLLLMGPLRIESTVYTVLAQLLAAGLHD
jgi:hypothetical protein